MGAILPMLNSHAGGVRDFLHRRAPGQSEQAISGSRGNITIAIAAAAGISALILLLLVYVVLPFFGHTLTTPD
jgi:hypothetical protein